MEVKINDANQLSINWFNGSSCPNNLDLDESDADTVDEEIDEEEDFTDSDSDEDVITEWGVEKLRK